MNTFGGLCMGACIFMIFFGMASGVIKSIDAFPSESVPTIDVTTAKENLTKTNSLTDLEGFLASYGVAMGLVIALSIFTGTTTLIGVWLFGAVFWAGWINVNTIFYAGGFLNNETGIAIVAMLWFGMIMMFIGAVISMLTPSSTSMR